MVQAVILAHLIIGMKDNQATMMVGRKKTAWDYGNMPTGNGMISSVLKFLSLYVNLTARKIKPPTLLVSMKRCTKFMIRRQNGTKHKMSVKKMEVVWSSLTAKKSITSSLNQLLKFLKQN